MQAENSELLTHEKNSAVTINLENYLKEYY